MERSVTLLLKGFLQDLYKGQALHSEQSRYNML